jgi:hypothetical protein
MRITRNSLDTALGTSGCPTGVVFIDREYATAPQVEG